MFLNQLNQSLSVTYLFLASAFRTVRKRKGELIWLENNTFLPGYAWAVSAPPATLVGLGRTSQYEGLSPACPGTGDAPSALRAVQHHLCQHTTQTVVSKTRYRCPVMGDYEVSFHAISLRSVLHPQYSTYGGESIAKWGELGGWNRKSRGASWKIKANTHR